MDEQRGQWKTRTGFIMAAMGSAIGLGNIWRFPYIAYENGGGVFLVPYFIALFLVGIPLMMLEFGLGHKMRLAFPGALRRIDRRFTWIGWWAVTFVMFGIVIYYCVVIAYCVCYFLMSFKTVVVEGASYAGWGADPGTFFKEVFLQRSDTIQELSQGAVLYNEETGQWILGAIRWPIVAALAGVWIVCWLISFAQ
ncbi:hypothetical protein JXA47_09475, partial [Candidatus Sumerlaeota bacterium]|nr:hypothetical protein [Candidatus Sumerlaeota bacterium]